MFHYPRLLAAALAAATVLTAQAQSSKPNIVVILADDLGYGDVQCYNPTRGKIPTPHLDQLAAQGLRFTDAHTSSGVCSPTRYALLTGRLHWRTRLQGGIVGLWEKPLIAPGRLTIAELLKQHGYRTAMVGKWHLGNDWPGTPEQRALLEAPPAAPGAAPTAEQRAAWAAIFSQPIGGGPVAHGFDTYFGTDVPNWPPFAFIENDRVQGVPSSFLPPALLRGHLASKQGPALPGWKLEEILPALGDRACALIAAGAEKPEPFFLYLPLTAPHTPIAVNAAWRGKSGLNNDYADFVMETDALVGRVLGELEKSGAAANTLVIFTSDNGCAPLVGLKALEAQGHFPSGPLRGHKTNAWEGGHRVPFIVRWPGVVPPGGRCDQLVMQADLMATFAEILGTKLPATAGEDSFSLLPLLRGGQEPVREFAVSAAANGVMALRRGPWKLIAGGGGSGRIAGKSQPGELYHLADDLGETKNLYAARPALVAELSALLDRIVNDGRSTPGPVQKNDVPVNWRRFLRAAAANPPAALRQD